MAQVARRLAFAGGSEPCLVGKRLEGQMIECGVLQAHRSLDPGGVQLGRQFVKQTLVEHGCFLPSYPGARDASPSTTPSPDIAGRGVLKGASSVEALERVAGVQH